MIADIPTRSKPKATTKTATQLNAFGILRLPSELRRKIGVSKLVKISSEPRITCHTEAEMYIMPTPPTPVPRMSQQADKAKM